MLLVAESVKRERKKKKKKKLTLALHPLATSVHF